MAPKRDPQGGLRRSTRVPTQATAALPVDGNNRITKPEAPPKPARRDCSTCDRTLAASAFYKRLPTKSCTHDVNTCKSCIKAWLATQLESTTPDKLSCPECPALLAEADVKRLATKEGYARYDDLQRRTFQAKTPGWRWCLAPNCRAGQVHTPLLQDTADTVSGDNNNNKTKKRTTRTKKPSTSNSPTTTATPDNADDKICTCTTCGARACIPCDRPDHPGETCPQHQSRVRRQTGAEEAASLAHIARDCKPCPNAACGARIEKAGGCDQVRCTRCGEAFCWLCGTGYGVVDVRGHGEGCVYARPDRVDPHAAAHAPGNAGLRGGLFAGWFEGW